MNIIIREANECDNSVLLSLLEEVQKIHVEGKPDTHKHAKVTFDMVYNTNIFEDPQYAVFSAVDDDNDQIVGYCILRIVEANKNPIGLETKKSIYLHELCVTKKYRGHNIGSLLVEKAKAFGKEVGAENLELSVWEFNTDALGFYEKMGMKTKIRRMEMKL